MASMLLVLWRMRLIIKDAVLLLMMASKSSTRASVNTPDALQNCGKKKYASKHYFYGSDIVKFGKVM